MGGFFLCESTFFHPRKMHFSMTSLMQKVRKVLNSKHLNHFTFHELFHDPAMVGMGKSRIFAAEIH